MKYSKLENKAIKCLEKGEKAKYYSLVLKICENDLDILDSINENLVEFFNVANLNKGKQKLLLKNVKELFQRDHAQINGQSDDLISWLDFLELEYKQTTKGLTIKVGE